MKQSVLMILYIFLLTACSAYNRIQTSKENGLKKMSLLQTPEVNLLKAKEDLTAPSDLKIITNYLYEEKAQGRPLVTLDIKIEMPNNKLNDSLIFITLDGENIPLSTWQGRYILAENLWVPIVHSKIIQYQINEDHDSLVLKLNEKQKNQLIEFLNKAIKYRDEIFPAIPKGQKKW